MPATTLSQIGEFGLIDLIKKQTRRPAAVIRGVGDDTAVLSLSSTKYLLLTTDMLIEGVHFLKRTPPKALGHKALAVNISDIAAMGGVPKYAVISLGTPSSCSKQFILQMYQGITATAKKYNVSIVGGDTVKSDKIIINVALTGEVNKRDVVCRNGARAGHQIFVTGVLGKSLSSGWHLKFVPRVPEGQYLVKKFKPSAMIDISDGLAADLGHILAESRVGALMDESLIPLRRGAKLKEALHDGEDFELLFTVPPSKARKLLNQKKFTVHRIGEIVAKSKGLKLAMADGRLKKINFKGYTHF